MTASRREESSRRSPLAAARRAAGSLFWRVWSSLAEIAARPYVVGSELDDALEACRRFEAAGIATAVCPWDEAGSDPGDVEASYHDALDGIAEVGTDTYLSIKAPSIGYSEERAGRLAEGARRFGARLHFDAQEPDSAGPTLELIRRLDDSGARLGATLPARWRRSPGDAEELAGRVAALRVVKGQWDDPGEPIGDVREAFVDLVDLLADRPVEVGVATHDAALAERSLRRLTAAGRDCELEQLYGLPLRKADVADPLGVPTRVYVPYGKAWLPYAIGRVRQRPRILFWVLRDLVRGRDDGIP